MLTHHHATSQRRRILLFPFGNSNGQPNDMVSVYLDYADTKREEGWHVCAQFALVISNPNDPRIYSTSREYAQAWKEGEHPADYMRSPLRSQRPITDSRQKRWTGE